MTGHPFNVDNLSIVEFSEKLARHQQTSDTFFDHNFVDLCVKQFSIYKALCVVRDDNLRFVRWVEQNREITDIKSHPYSFFCEHDPNAAYINSICVNNPSKNHGLFRSTDIINRDRYNADYANWLVKNIRSKYSLVIPFDHIGKYHMCFYKRMGEPDFSDQELDLYSIIARVIALNYDQFLERRQNALLSSSQKTALQVAAAGYVLMDAQLNVLDHNENASKIFENMEVGAELNTGKLEFLRLLFDTDDVVGTSRHRLINGFNFYFVSFSFHDKRYYLLILTEAADVKNLEYTGLPIIPKLTVREREVVDLLAAGLTYYEVASALHISFNTVKNHLQNIYQKCSVKNQAHLISSYTTEKIVSELRGLQKDIKK